MAKHQNIIPEGGLLFAPMEGITDAVYRKALHEVFPEWDRYSTDFLRLPSQGEYSDQKMIQHFGEDLFRSQAHKKKTTFQILTTPKCNNIHHIKLLDQLGFTHLDINLGCPSKRVNSHQGGAYLLSDLVALKGILTEARESFQGHLSAKIRIGYRDDKDFLSIIKLIEDEGIDSLTIHARTRDQLYLGKANWKYLKQAVETLKIPVIGNGDIWELNDISAMFQETGCHAVMLGRGALKTPWMAGLYQEHKENLNSLNEDFLLYERKKNIDSYFYTLEKYYKKNGKEEAGILRRFKAFSRYLFDDFENPQKVREGFFRSDSLEQFQENLNSLGQV
jgi:tRNA-dihydrouridine synthase B